MVVAFVGFVGGYAQGLLGPELLFVAGALAAVIVTWFTFLPSFLFILVGGPLVEATKEDLKFTAPLTAITAAVVGVILNLAVFFGYHVLWPTGLAGHFDWGAALITAGAATALFRFKRGVIEVITLALSWVSCSGSLHEEGIPSAFVGFVSTWQGWLYVAFVIDVYARRIVG